MGKIVLGNKRRPRRLLSAPLGCLALGEYTMESTVEIGEGGLMMKTLRRFANGSRILLNFYIPGGEILVVPANIVWCRTNEEERINYYGVEFRELDFALNRILRTYIAAKSQDELMREKDKFNLPEEATA